MRIGNTFFTGTDLPQVVKPPVQLGLCSLLGLLFLGQLVSTLTKQVPQQGFEPPVSPIQALHPKGFFAQGKYKGSRIINIHQEVVVEFLEDETYDAPLRGRLGLTSLTAGCGH